MSGVWGSNQHHHHVPPPPPPQAAPPAAGRQRSRFVIVTDPEGDPREGLLLSWRRTPTGTWEAYVIWVADDTTDPPVTVQAWTPTDKLTPARPGTTQ